MLTLLQLTRDRGPALDAYHAMVSWDKVPRNLLSYVQYLAYPIPFAAAWLGLRWRRKPLLLIARASSLLLS